MRWNCSKGDGDSDKADPSNRFKGGFVHSAFTDPLPGFKFLLGRAFVIGRRRESLADSTLLASRRSLDRRLSRLLAIEPDTEAGLKLRRGIEKCQDKLFVFVTRRDVPPTNNVSEQRLRPSVISERDLALLT